jgi:hypothetical protein
MKTRELASIEDVDELIATVTRSADATLARLAQPGGSSEGLRALWQLKFSSFGCDPLTVEVPLNLIEQINQTFTYLASARAVKLLLKLYPDLAPFTVNLGTSPGSDIKSDKAGGLAAEVFAAVNTSNNRKLIKDIAKVGQTTARLKYVFFMCPGYPEGRQQKLEGSRGVHVWSVGGN